MISEELLIKKYKALPGSRQQQVLNFVEILERKDAELLPRRNLSGSLTHLNIDFTEEDLREARNEMWRGYTKDT